MRPLQVCRTSRTSSLIVPILIHTSYSDHINNTGIHIWLTGDWLEDSSTMKPGYKYELKIIDDETGDYNFSPGFDLIVPYSTFTQQNTGGKDDKSAKKGSNKDITNEDVDFVEPEQTKDTTYVADTDDKDSEGEDPTLGVGKDHQYQGNPKPHDKGTQTKGGQKTNIELDFIEPEKFVPEDEDKDGKPKFNVTSTDSDEEEEDYVEPDPTPTPSNKPPPNGNTKTVANADTQTNTTQQDQNSTATTSSSSGGLSKGAIVGIAVGVVVVVVSIILGIGLWKLSKHKKVMVEKKRSRIGYDGVGGFIAKGRDSMPYGGPQMAQYTPRQSIETRYDPPTGQGLPVVGSTPRHSVDTRYDPPGRHSVDTRYDPPSQAPQAHH